MDWGVARFLALAVGATVDADAGPAVVWWFGLIAGVGAALAVAALASAIARRTAAPEPVATAEPAAAAV